MHKLCLNNIIIGYSPQESLEYVINYHFVAGSMYYIQGKNGSGKTTLMRTICKYLLPISGNLTYLNKTLTSAYYGHQNALKPKMLVKDYLKFCKIFFNDTRLMDNLIKIFNIENFLNLPIYYLSYGQQKRVSLVGFLSFNSDIYCFDEASSGLDTDFKHIFYDYLEKLSSQEEKIIIFSDHNQPYIKNIIPFNFNDYKNIQS
jgi:ABC-type multidrug transport system ATPase subunit